MKRMREREGMVTYLRRDVLGRALTATEAAENNARMEREGRVRE